MNKQPGNRRPIQKGVINRISNRLCATVLDVQKADLKLLADGDLLAMLQELANEVRQELYQRRAQRAALLSEPSPIA